MRALRCLMLIFFGFFLLVPPGVARAETQERAVIRAGVHDRYSRLVFEWPKPVGYALERPEPGRLVLRFEVVGSLDTSGFQSVPNVSGMAIVSENPLAVSIAVPEKSRVRDMAAGARVILDVYNPPEEVEKPKEKPKEKPEEKKEAEEKKTPKPVKEEAGKPAESPVGKSPAAVAEKADGKAPEPAPAQAGKTANETVRIKPRTVPTVIVQSSTQSFGMAAFALGGRLFIVSDKSDILTAPQVSGPAAAQIGNPEEIRIDHGKAYTVNAPPAFGLAGHGGGLVWRVMTGPDLEEKGGAEPQRKNVDPDKDRGGELLFPLEGARSIIEMTDPFGGQKIIVVTVADSSAFAGRAREFVDFDVLRSPVGLAVVPKVDDLEVKIGPEGATVSRPAGLTLTGTERIESAGSPAETAVANIPRLFDFRGWQLGGAPALAENRTIVLGGLKGLDESARIESLLTLAKMYLSNAMGPEALGVLRLAEQEMPGLKDSAEFTAFTGVAEALSQHMEPAFAILSGEEFKSFIETGYWRAYALAGLEDWLQAAEVLPRDIAVLGEYPDVLFNRLAPVLAEVALRAGDVALGEKILKRLEAGRKTMDAPQRAATDYLKGEAARQKGKVEEAEKLWKPLASGSDDFYRVRAVLALTRLGMDRKDSSDAKVIDALERQRYAWRGDELEAQVNYWLGRAYFNAGEYIKGLKIMREATTFARGGDLAERIASDMIDLFTGLFLGPELEKVSPPDAVALYDQFAELVPPDERGDRLTERLVEYLAGADLLTRAGEILEHQIRHRLEGEAAYRAAMRLSAIRLLDNKPVKALEALNAASQKLETLPDEYKTPENYRALSMLRARALSRQGHPDRALSLLRGITQTPEVDRLRADIAWASEYWEEAAEALGDVVTDRNISMTRPLAEKDTDLLMRLAVALNLAGDRIALANMREKYTDLMNQTGKAKIFEVITRPRQSSALADRETLLGIVSEVDLFADFLNSYKTVQPPPAE